MSRIANPVFNGSPLDDLQAVDVYNEVADSVRNSFTTQFSAFGQSLQDSLGQLTGGLGSLRSDLQNGATNVTNATQRIKDTLRGARGDLDKLRDGLMNGIIESTGVDVDGLKELKVSIEGEIRRFKAADLDSAKGIMSLARDLTGNDVFNLVDLGAEVGLFRGVLEEVSAWGIPELVDSVLGEIDDPLIRRQVVQASTGVLGTNGDIDSIEAILNQVGAAPLTAGRPDFPKRVLQRYKFKKGTTPENYPDRLAQLVGVMNRLQFDWLWTQRNGEAVWNLSVIQHASADARTLFLSTDEYRTPMLIAGHYTAVPVTTLMRDTYPGIAV